MQLTLGQQIWMEDPAHPAGWMPAQVINFDDVTVVGVGPSHQRILINDRSKVATTVPPEYEHFMNMEGKRRMLFRAE